MVVVACVSNTNGQKLALALELVEERLVSTPSAVLAESPEDINERTEVLAEIPEDVVDAGELLDDDEMNDKVNVDDEGVGANCIGEGE